MRSENVVVTGTAMNNNKIYESFSREGLDTQAPRCYFYSGWPGVAGR